MWSEVCILWGGVLLGVLCVAGRCQNVYNISRPLVQSTSAIKRFSRIEIGKTITLIVLYRQLNVLYRRALSAHVYVYIYTCCKSCANSIYIMKCYKQCI